MPTKSWKNHPKKLMAVGSFFFSAATPAQNSPELPFRFIIFFIQPSLLESLQTTTQCFGWVFLILAILRRGFVPSFPCQSHSALCNVYPVIALDRTTVRPNENVPQLTIREVIKNQPDFRPLLYCKLRPLKGWPPFSMQIDSKGGPLGTISLGCMVEGKHCWYHYDYDKTKQYHTA